MSSLSAVVNPVAVVYNLLADRIRGIAVTADDNVTILGPTLSAPGVLDPASTVYVKRDPYQQEAEIAIPVPLVVVGPRVGPRSYTPFPGYLLSEVHETVEVRVMTRDIDDPVRVDGDMVRSKLLQGINAIVQANHFDPDGTHAIQYIAVKDPGRDANEPQGSPLYKSVMQVEVAWFE